MMKKVMVGAGAVIVVAAAMPYTTGYIVQNSIESLTAQMNNNSEQYGVSEIVSYDRGYSESQSRYIWTLPAPYAQEVGAIEYRCEGKHGFLSYDYQCQIEKLDVYDTFVNEQLSGKDPLSFEGSVSIFGKVYNKIQLDGFAFNHQGQAVEVKPTYIEGGTDLSLSFVDMSGEFGGITIVDTLKQDNITIGRATLTSHLVMKSENLGIGDSEVLIDAMSIKGPTQDIHVSQLAINIGIAEVSDNNIDIDYSLSADSLDTSNTLTGQSFNTENGKLLFLVGNLNIEKYLALIDQLNALSQVNGNDEVTLEQQQAEIATLLPSLEALLQKGLRLKWGVSADLDQQRTSLDTDIRLIDTTTLAEASSFLFNHELLLEKAELNLDLVIAESVLEKIGPAQAVVTSHPAIEKVGSAYESHIQLKKDDVKLNDNSLTLKELSTLILGR